MPRVSFYTLGCKLNTYDTEWYQEQFAQAGYEVVPFGQVADVTVVNTCTVTGQGDAQSRQALRKAARVSPDATLVAVGCYAQTDPDALLALPEVDLVVGMEARGRLLDLINATCSIGRSHVARGRAKDFQEMDISAFGGRSRAFVKVQEGCDQFCSFCIIPFARGRSRSRSVESAVAQVRRLVQAGYREVVLTGVHIGDYASNGAALLDLLTAVEEIEGLARFRVSSIEAAFIPDAEIDLFARSKKFCRHLHVPLQSGDDRILSAMRRPYTSAQYRDLMRNLSDRIPGIGLGADVMVGFPGEDEEAFENTFKLIEEIPLVYLHVFPYSPRQDTPAAKMPHQVEPRVKAARAARLRDLGARKADTFRREAVGQTFEVLFEGRRDPEAGLLNGLTDTYIRVFAPGPDAATHRIVPVRIERVEGDRAIGRIVGEVDAGVSVSDSLELPVWQG
ncbi:MAG: tRNA (N(6)-L-threonylcarbamoyladenosine(37)-C(2))-methylthiotransferase MtaB [Candidatus Latescibacteria bacterium]|nr:tRNA (N(6)-L-threonylcarbamoyladenosine(37)-C(2))-methylthiotransferase MtaB [Candidatus Latescibacterota bacterium]